MLLSHYQVMSVHYREQLILIYAFDVDLDLDFDFDLDFDLVLVLDLAPAFDWGLILIFRQRLAER